MSVKPDINDVLSGLFGFAAGDALGVPIEFTSRESHVDNPVREMRGYGAHSVPEGTWSDDTSMTIAGMDAISQINGRISFENIMRAYLAWMDDAMYTATDEVFDIGIATRKALMRFESGAAPTECGGFGKYDNGNGSLMRMLPLVYWLYVKKLNRQDEIEMIKDYSSLTHRHDISRFGCVIYYDLMKMLLDGMQLGEACDKLCETDYSPYFEETVIAHYERILSGEIKKCSEDDISSSGYVVHTLEASIWAVLNADNFEEAVIKAVNLGDDTDTVGAVAGSIAGIMYGLEAIPERWLNKLRKRDYLEAIAVKFHSKITQDPDAASPRFM